MGLRDQPKLTELVVALAIAGSALLACKKSESEATPTATASAVPTPEATVAPEAPSAAEPTPTASAEPTPTAVATTTTVKPTTTATTTTVKDAGVAKTDAGTTADAGRLSSTSAADAQAISACCGKLNAEAAKGGMNANKYKSAAAVCGGIAQSVKSGKANAASARTMIRAQLQGVPVPGGC